LSTSSNHLLTAIYHGSHQPNQERRDCWREFPFSTRVLSPSRSLTPHYKKATGRVGGAFAEALAKTGQHNITALARAGGTGTVPEGVKKVEVDYDNEESVTAALRGQQFLVITISATAPQETHANIVRAAGRAGVPYIMPNLYGNDYRHKSIEEPDWNKTYYATKIAEVESTGVSSYIAMVCGFWYEWSLALGENTFGFNIKDRKVIFFDEGNTPISVSTWDQCGRALVALLSLPESGASPSVADWKNKPLYISSFRVTQRDMLDSLHRVLGTADKDWEITYESSAKRYKDGLEEQAAGSRQGFAKALYSPAFFPSGRGDFETNQGLANQLLGLPKESLDEATKRVVAMVESGWNPFSS